MFDNSHPKVVKREFATRRAIKFHCKMPPDHLPTNTFVSFLIKSDLGREMAILPHIFAVVVQNPNVYRATIQSRLAKRFGIGSNANES